MKKKQKGRRTSKRKPTVDKAGSRRYDTGSVLPTLVNDPVANVLLMKVLEEIHALERETGSKVYLHVLTPAGEEWTYESKDFNTQHPTLMNEQSPPRTSTATQTDNQCALCYKPHVGTGDSDLGPWVECDTADCLYWSHFKCQGFYLTKEDAEELREETEFLFYCPKHR